MSLDYDIIFLARLAVKAKLNNSFSISTVKLAKQLNISQQSVSRKIRLLKEKGLIKAESGALGTTIRLTEAGKKRLFAFYSELREVFQGFEPNTLKGVITKGLGEGAYYVSRKQYLKQFERLLGFKPFIGTLNLLVDEAQISCFLEDAKPFIVKGFKSKERTFGDIKCFFVKIKDFDYNALLIFPERTFHKNQVELIAKDNLRKKFSLKDNDLITIALS